jgi:glutathione peroxidase
MTMSRRQACHLLAGVALSSLGSASASAQTSAMSRTTAYAFAFKTPDGSDLRLVQHAGKPILIVNTASLCGYTPQYSGLQTLWTRYRDRGLLVIGVPSNDFGGQEPGGAAEIAKTASAHDVSFPLTAKVDVRGDNAHPFYRWAAVQRPLDTPRWNFHKYLVGRDGQIVAAFPPAVDPLDVRLIAAIERELTG